MDKNRRPAKREVIGSAVDVTRLTAVLLLAILAAGALFAWWVVERADRDMRADLLQQARVVAQAVNIENVRALSGTEADLESPDYRRLKEQFTAIRSANPQCRFVYLLGRKADGVVFFFLDSELAGSKDYSPPGQVFKEVSEACLRVFDTRAEDVEGPVADQWGTWVSALVPISDTAYKGTGGLLAVMGMDIDASTWNSNVAARAALPLGLMMVLFIGATSVFGYTRRTEAGIRARQAELRESEARYRMLAESMKDIVWLIDMNLKTTFHSPSGEKLRGFTIPEIMEMPLEKTLTSESFKLASELFFEEIPRVVADPGYNPVRTLDLEYSCKDGATVWVESKFSIIRDQRGKPVSILGEGRDISDQKRAEDALQKTDNAYRLLAENMSDVVSILDMDLSVRWISDSAGRTNGYTLEEQQNLPLDKQMTPESLKKSLDMFIYALEEEKTGSADPNRPYEMELEIYRKDGSTFWTENRFQFVRDSQGKAISILMQGGDITERRKAQEALQKTEKTYRLLAEHMSDIVWMMDLDLKVTWVSPSAVKARGYTLDELIALPLDRQITPESLGKAAHLIGKWTHTEREGRTPEPHGSISTELEFYRKDGSTFVAECSFQFLRDEQGKATGILAEGRDITERKKAEKAILESEEKYRMVVENALEAISISVDAKLVFANRRMAALSGYSQDELISRSITEFIHPDDLEMVIDLQLRRWKGENVPNIYSFRVVDKAGNILWREVSTVLITWEGKPATLNFMTDISDRKRMEEERLRVAKLESVGVLAGGIAHDFNNILTSIMGNINLASLEAAPGSELQSSLEQAEKASQRARALTQQLLTFSKGGSPVRKLASLAELLTDTAGFALSGSNVKCDFFIPAYLWHAEIDAGQVSQIIHNLAINAQQAMPAGGTIELRAENIALSETQKLGKELPLKAGKYIRITVADNGSGISKEHLEKIFDPFFTTKKTGTGLGLATSFSIARNHGGHLSVESVIGTGSTFYLYLPASLQKSAPEQDKQGQIKPVGKARILVMDDEQGIREIAGRMLKHIGYEDVEFTEDGAEAIKLYKAAMKAGNPFTVAILDLTIAGGMGGKEAVKKLLKIDPGVKAIVSSGYIDDSVMAEYRKYGFSGIVAKPYSLQQLRKALSDVIGAA